MFFMLLTETLARRNIHTLSHDNELAKVLTERGTFGLTPKGSSPGVGMVTIS
jgi:hypothetical protein